MTSDKGGKEAVQLSEILTPITPTEYRGMVDPEVTEYCYDSVNWKEVDEEQLVNDDEIVAYAGYPGAYDTVKADDFEALRTYFDSTISETNVIYITDDQVYVYGFSLENVREKKLKAEILTTLRELEYQGLIIGLDPIKERG